MSTATNAASRTQPGEHSFQSEVRAVVGGLRDAVRAALGEEGEQGSRPPADLSRDLGLDTKLGWKLHWVLVNDDPFAAALFVPGRAGVGIIAEGLRRAGASAEAAASVTRAGEAFHRCVTRHAENRAGFDTLLAAHSSDERAALEHRRQAYQGSRYIWGIETRANLLTYIVHPSAGGETMDVASIRGIIGCQRLREHVPWRVGRTTLRRPEGVDAAFKREPVDPALGSMNPGDGLPIMGTYCTDPLPAIDRVPGPHGAVEFQLGPGPVGKRGRFDLITGEVVRAMQPRFAEEGDPPLRMRFGVRIPAQMAVFDVLMHKEMFARSAPRVSMLSDLFASELGSTHQPADELPNAPELEILRVSADALAVDEAPRFGDAVDEALGVLGWSAESFDLFRVAVPYPAVPTTMVMAFDPTTARRG
jgi:hypothetical protein|tara:strand:- start:2044 stop:3300 length:1257 start_codon:yes stop_codon:yes gene_type:complete